LPGAKPRRVAFFYALLRGLGYSAARKNLFRCPLAPARCGGRMLSELAPVMTTTLSLIPAMKFCFVFSAFTLVQRSSISPNYRAQSLDSKHIVTNSGAGGGTVERVKDRDTDSIAKDIWRDLDIFEPRSTDYFC